MVDTLENIYVGRRQFLMPSGDPTGIFKEAIGQPARVEKQGFVDDYQADKRVHGGPEKAVHQFAQASYAVMSDAFPALQADFVPGAMGENLSSPDLNESCVHIGDIVQIGSCVLQVSQPRSPCWKINDKFGNEKLSRLIQQKRISGWYYRIMECGTITPCDPIVLLDRLQDGASIDRFLTITNEHRPSIADLDEVLSWRGLNEDWRDRIKQRRRWLIDNGFDDR